MIGHPHFREPHIQTGKHPLLVSESYQIYTVHAPCGNIRQENVFYKIFRLHFLQVSNYPFRELIPLNIVYIHSFIISPQIPIYFFINHTYFITIPFMCHFFLVPHSNKSHRHFTVLLFFQHLS